MRADAAESAEPTDHYAHDRTGCGERGEQDGRSGEATFANAMIVVACPPSRTTAFVEDLRPLLKRYGGVCLVSDAMSLRH